jgi:hypothetical protein
MIIVRLIGGLGNQLFQYAAARRLARHRGVRLKLDLSWYRNNQVRSYRLHAFNIRAQIAGPQELAAVRPVPQRSTREKLHWLRQIVRRYRYWTILHEESLRPLDPAVRNVRGKVYLDGYWQTAKYFCDIAPIIQREYTLKYALSNYAQEMTRWIAASDSVGVHIRRGDYVADPVTNAYHGVCSLEYYHSCMHRLAEATGRPHFFVFSDDIDWAAEHLKPVYPLTFVSGAGQTVDYEDLWLMSQCRHQIIANSSFSWWAAWLNSNPEKLVCAPRRWLRAQHRDTRDVVPEEWIRV